MNVRNVEFVGGDFDGFEPEKDTDFSKLETFIFAGTDLCECKIEYEMPIEVIADGKIEIANLSVHIELGKPDKFNGIERSDVLLILSYDEKFFSLKRK